LTNDLYKGQSVFFPGVSFVYAFIFHIKLGHYRTLNIASGILNSLWNEKPRWWWSKERKGDYQKKKAICDTAHSRRGFLSDCLCLDCMEQQELDLEKDKRRCQSCLSVNVKSVKELLGSICPKCKEGIILEIDTGFVS